MHSMVVFLVIAGAVVAVAALWFFMRLRAQAQQQRRVDRRRRHVAHQRAWDWLMGRSKQLRITHAPDGDGQS